MAKNEYKTIRVRICYLSMRESATREIEVVLISGESSRIVQLNSSVDFECCSYFFSILCLCYDQNHNNF